MSKEDFHGHKLQESAQFNLQMRLIILALVTVMSHLKAFNFLIRISSAKPMQSHEVPQIYTCTSQQPQPVQHLATAIRPQPT